MIQKILFDRIRARLKPGESLVNEVSDLLSVSTDSAYRRLRGDTEISLQEAARLAAHYHLSLDELMGAGDRQAVTFQLLATGEGSGKLASQLELLGQTLEEFSGDPETLVTYFSSELPLFHHLQVQEVRDFKVYYWRKMGGAENLENFRLGETPPGIDQLCSRMLNAWMRISSQEILLEGALTSTLQQIAFFFESGFFADPEEAIVVLKKLSESVDHLKQEAEQGFKFRFGGKPVGKPGNFQLYHNEIVMTGNIAHVRRTHDVQVYLEHNVLDFMLTRDEGFCDYTASMLDRIKSKSVLISSVSERERNKFFNRLQLQIRKMQERIQLML